MTSLFKKLENPVITDLTIERKDGRKIEMYPEPLPDLYAGEPINAFLKSSEPFGEMYLKGVVLGESRSIQISGEKGRNGSGIAVLWARKKIRSLMDALYFGAAEAEVRRQVIDTSIKHHLVSRYTSLVAVEEEISRNNNKPLGSRQVKTNIPQGWQHKMVFGGTAKTATHSKVAILWGIILMMIGLIVLRKQQRLLT